MKNTLILLIISFSIHAQTKPFTPTKGEIVFRETTKITDRKLFGESLKILKEELIKSLKESVSEEDNDGREQEIEQMIEQSSDMMESMLFPEKSSQTYHHKFDKSKIISFVSSNNKVLGDYEIIDTNKATSSILAKKDSVTIFGEKSYPYSTHVIIKITEDKKDRKTINGYDCYKVTYEYKESNNVEEEDFLNLINDIAHKREMWVTDKIKTLFHPVIFEKSILEKYYPLYILET